MSAKAVHVFEVDWRNTLMVCFLKILDNDFQGFRAES